MKDSYVFVFKGCDQMTLNFNVIVYNIQIYELHKTKRGKRKRERGREEEEEEG